MMASDKHHVRGAKTNGNAEIGIIWVKREFLERHNWTGLWGKF